MKFFKVFVLFFLFVHSNAHISIQIDDENFLQVADFLQVFGRGPIQPYEHSCILRNLKKFNRVLFHMCSAMITLVASNLITAKFATVEPQNQDNQLEIHFANNSFIGGGSVGGGDVFSTDFGCHNAVCWRTCYTEDPKQKDFWCYTSPQLNSREYETCTHQTDCSQYWECLDSCHGKTDSHLKFYQFSNWCENSVFSQVTLKMDHKKPTYTEVCGKKKLKPKLPISMNMRRECLVQSNQMNMLKI